MSRACDAKQSLLLRLVQICVAASHKTAGKQLALYTCCTDFDKRCLYHPLIHPHMITLCPIDCLNCLGHLWISNKSAPIKNKMPWPFKNEISGLDTLMCVSLSVLHVTSKHVKFYKLVRAHSFDMTLSVEWSVNIHVVQSHTFLDYVRRFKSALNLT